MFSHLTTYQKTRAEGYLQRMRPIDLIQGEMHSISFVSLFETMGSRCAETLPIRLSKEWGVNIGLDSDFQQAEINWQTLLESENNDPIINHYVINSHIQTTLLIDRTIPSLLVDIACGGIGEVSAPKQRLTVSESHMLNRLVTQLTTHYAKAIEQITNSNEISFTPIENNEAISNSSNSVQPELIHTLKISLGNSTADIRFIISEKNFRLLQIKKTHNLTSAVDSLQLKQAIHGVPVLLTATLCEYTSTLREVRQLQPGDFIPIRMSSVASVHSGGQHLFNARVVKQDERLCLQMLEPVSKPLLKPLSHSKSES